MPQRLILEAYHLSWNHIQRCEKWIHLSSSQVETKEKNYIGALGRELLPGLEKTLHILRFHFFSFWQRVFTLVGRDPTIKRRWKEKHLILCAVSLWYGLPSLVFVLIKLNNHMKLTSFAVASPRQLTIEVLFHCPSFCSCRWPNTQRQKPVCGKAVCRFNTCKSTLSPLQGHSVVCCLDLVTLFAAVNEGAVAEATF